MTCLIRVVMMALFAVAAAQPSAQEPSFEVASVKVTERSGGGFTLLPVPSGRVRFDGADMASILSIAFDVPIPMSDMRIVWTRAAEAFKYRPGFEILATAPPGGGDQKAMLRTLLRERFGLRYHREVRQTPVFRLVVKEPGKLGPRLKPSPHNCRADRTPEICRSTREVRRSAGAMQEFIEAVAISATAFERPVLDATGLTGNFEWEFAVPSNFRDGRVELDEVFEAFENQLGLKLERVMAPWEVIVIDDVRMPTPN